MKILVADDRGHLLASTLTSKGFETTLTSTWEDTQKVLGTQIFDVVLLDLFGNSHDSWESFLDQVRFHHSGSLILISGRDSGLLSRLAESSGSKWLQKPFAFDTLISTLNSIV